MSSQVSSILENLRSLFPSSVPVRAPSPDTKSSNKLARTVSPQIQSRGQQSIDVSPPKPAAYQKQIFYNESVRFEQIEIGGGTFSGEDIARLKRRIEEQDKVIEKYHHKSGEKDLSVSRMYLSDIGNDEFKQRLAEKDKVISELKKVVGNLSEKRYAPPSVFDQDEYQQKLKALEFENQRLGEIVRKFHKKEGQSKLVAQNKTLSLKVQQLTEENRKLSQKIEKSQKSSRQSLTQKTNQANIIINLEQKNKGLEKQNEKLIKLLKDSKDSQRSYPSQRNLQEQITRLNKQNRLLKEKIHPEKVSITKIKEQYEQSLKIFKHTVYKEVSRQFEKFQDTVKSLNEKIEELQQRTDRINSASASARLQSPEQLARLVKSSRSHEYDSPIKQETDKKQRTQPRLLFEATNVKQTNSEAGTHPQVSRLQNQLQTQRKKRGELEQKYDILNHEYNLLKEDHMNSLSEIQKYLKKIDELRGALDRGNFEVKQQKGRQRFYFSEKTRIQERSQIIQTDTAALEKIMKAHEQEIASLKDQTKTELNRLIETYEKEIQDLRSNIAKKSKDFSELAVAIKSRQQRQQQELVQKQAQIDKLVASIGQSKCLIQITEQRIQITETSKKQFDEVAETRNRSYTLMESSYNQLLLKYKALEAERNELLSYKQNFAGKYQKELSEQANIVMKLRKSKQEAIQEMKSQCDRNEMLTEQNHNLSEKVKELQNQRVGLAETLSILNEERSQLEFKINDLVQQSQQIKISLKDPNTQKIFGMLGQIALSKTPLNSKIEIILQQSETVQLKLKSQIAELQRQNKLLQLKLETTQKQLQIRLAQTVTLCNLLEQHVKEKQKNSERFAIKAVTEIQTQFEEQEAKRIQQNYNQSLTKLEKLIKDLEHLKVQPQNY